MTFLKKNAYAVGAHVGGSAEPVGLDEKFERAAAPL